MLFRLGVSDGARDSGVAVCSWENRSRRSARMSAVGSKESLIAASSAYRVKYRKPMKLKPSIAHLGTHRSNRGGQYPSGPRCKSLSVEVIEAGSAKEDMGHQLVAVEETPADHIRSSGSGYQSGAGYNKEKSSNDEPLCTCFAEPFGDVRVMLPTAARSRG